MSAEIGTDENPQHWHEDIGDDVGNRLNWLRAGVLGVLDGQSSGPLAHGVPRTLAVKAAR